jgi:hypothetical protein
MRRAKHYTDEYCPHCEREVRIPARVRPVPKCPRCKKELMPCSACDDETHKRCATCHTKNDCSKDGKIRFKLHPGFKAKKTGFTLKALLKIVDKVYDSHVVLSPYIADADVGDTLATFIVRELKDTFDVWATKDKQLAEAARVIGVARAQLENVECALLEGLRKELNRETNRRIQKRRKGIKK